MKLIKLFTFGASILFSVSVFASCDSADGAATDNQSSRDDAITFAMSMGMGWNLGNNLDAHNDGVAVETGWGNPVATQKTFDAIKAAGFSSVRIPVTWLGHVGYAPEYRIEKAWLNRVAEVAGYAKKAGLKAIINIHHDGAAADGKMVEHAWLDLAAAAKDEQKNQEIKQKLAMMWMQIANHFKDEGDWLIFETMNEVQDGYWGQGENTKDGGQQYRVLNEWNQLCVDVIRSTGGQNTTRYIGIPGYVCQPGLTCDYLRIPDDETPNHILVAVHMYDPWDYAGSAKYAEWGHTGNVEMYKKGELEYSTTLNNLYNKFVRKGIPVYLGEYGNVHRSTARAEEFRKYYLEYTIKSLRDHKMPVLVWDNGNNKTGDDAFGLINHGNGKYIANGKEIVKIMVDAWNNNDPNYTLQSIYERAPESK